MDSSTKVFWLTISLFVLGLLTNFIMLIVIIPSIAVSAYLTKYTGLTSHLTAFTLGYICGLTPSSLIYSRFVLPLPFLVYMSSMSIAHIFEYLFVCRFHYNELKWDSFLINQSKAYVFAAVFSWTEFYLTYNIKPTIMIELSLAVGLAFITLGHYCRIGAMFTAKKSFHHLV